MVNVIWMAMLLAGVLAAAANNQIELVTVAALDSARASVSFAIELVGILAFWMGLLKVAEAAGLIEDLARIVRPLISWLFPRLPAGHPALGAIITNLTASMLGLGNAATPFGLKAMQELQKLNENPDEASEEMCTFLALNTSCITLLPATIIGIRAAAGSIDPTEIVIPTMLVTLAGSLAAITFDQVFKRWWRAKAISRREGGVMKK